MSRFSRSVLICFLIVFMAGTDLVLAQTSENKRLFEGGVINYQNHLYKEAFQSFETVLSKGGDNPYLTASYLMLGKTTYQLGDLQRAQSYINYLLTAYPESRYTPHADYLLGQLELENGNYDKAFYHFAQSLEKSTNSELDGLAETACDTLIALGLSPSQLLDIYHSYPWKKNKLAFQFWVAESLLRQGESAAADKILDSILENEPQNQEIRQRVRNMQAGNYIPAIKVGVVVPITGFFSNEARELVRGMALALHEEPDVARHINVRIADSKGSQVGTVLTTLSMGPNDFSLLIGELEDNNSISLAGYASEEKLPLIIPVATSNGLASIGEYIFQANNDLNVRGAALAEFAIKQQGMHTFATLAPADEYGHTLTDAFTNKVDQLGGTIIAQKWYYPGTTDMKRQFDAIREAGLRHGFRDSLQVKGLTVTPARIDSIFDVQNALAKKESDDEKGLIESTNIPVNSIDGFFLPIYAEELSIIAPQMALSNIHTTPLGGGYWLDPVILRRQRNYLDGSIFVTSNYTSETDLEYKKFQNNYRQLTASSPTKMSIYGYNIMKMILQGVAQGNYNKKSLVNFINESGPFDGIGGQISFQNSNRVNKAVNILQYKEGNLTKIN